MYYILQYYSITDDLTFTFLFYNPQSNKIVMKAGSLFTELFCCKQLCLVFGIYLKGSRAVADTPG